MMIGKTHARHISSAKLHALQPCGLILSLPELEQLVREIDRDYLALGAENLCSGQRRGAGTTADIKNVCPATQT